MEVFMKNLTKALLLLPSIAFITSCNKGQSITTSYNLTKYETNAYYADNSEELGTMKFEFPDNYKFKESEENSYTIECGHTKTGGIYGKDMAKLSAIGYSEPAFYKVKRGDSEAVCAGICLLRTYIDTKSPLAVDDWFKFEFTGKLIKDGKTLTEFKKDITFTYKG